MHRDDLADGGGVVTRAPATVRDLDDAGAEAADAGRPPPSHARVPITIEVVWGSIGTVQADVIAVGHYEGLYPTAAELALDEAISGAHDPGTDPSEDRPSLLRVATARGVLRGALGDVFVVPSRRVGDPRVAAVLGLGRPGTFQLPQHEVLVRNMVWTAERMVDAASLACVLIGSGAGNLSVEDAVDNIVRALDAAVTERELTGRLQRLRIVEFELGRARAILASLTRAVAARDRAAQAAIIDLVPTLTDDGGGTVDPHTALAAIVDEAALGQPAALREWLEHREADPRIVEAMLAAIGRAAGDGARYVVAEQRPPAVRGVPTRLSVLAQNGNLVASAVSDAATVPERDFGLSRELFTQLVELANAQAKGDPAVAGRMLLRVAIPADFRPLLEQDRDVIIEVDRATAALPWEVLGSEASAAVRLRPLGLRTALARQLRTRRSPPPAVTGRIVLGRALIIGDPAGGAGHLPGAEREARAVAELFAERGVPFDILLGPEGATDPRAGWTARPATLANVLHHLVHEEYQLVHYAGHGTFSPDDPGRGAGWLLADGLLTGEHLTIVERLPPLVVANACHSSRVSTDLPGLADEFMGRGVRNLAGSARTVDDESARRFSETFYAHLLVGLRPPAAGEAPPAPTLGRAVLAARRELDDHHLPDWDVYQLYGDPTFRFWPDGARGD